MIKDLGLEIARHARNNINNWGMQDFLTLIAVAAEELGETATEVLAHKDDCKCNKAMHFDRIRDEAKDFAAVGLQIMALVDDMRKKEGE